MILILIYLIFSFILECFMSNIFTSTFSDISYFTTIYTIIALVIIYPYFYNCKKYYVLVVVFGFLFDVIYTSTFLINIVIFLIIGLVIKVLNNIFSDNIFMMNLISIISVILYHILSFIILSLVNYNSYDIILLINIITHSLIMTVIYTSISYFSIKFIFNRFGIKQIK